MSVITLTGIYTPPLPETRILANIDVEHNGNVYKWQAYIPPDENLNDYLESIRVDIENDIDAKELIWVNLDPKTREVDTGFGEETIIVDIEKDEIVRPDIPDAYAKKRNEYPLVGDQLDAIWRGDLSDEYLSLFSKIQSVKNKYSTNADDSKKRIIEEINLYRNLRIKDGFFFNGVKFDSGPDDQKRISGASLLAIVALTEGIGTVDNFYWHGGEMPFTWIAKDNSFVQMDAPTVVNFAKAAAAWETSHIFAARILKDMDPIPTNYKDNVYWPAD